MDCSPGLARVDTRRGSEIVRITRAGLLVNLLLVASKLAAGYLGNSRALVADGVHSVADMVTNIAVLIGVRFWSAPPTANHPYGYRRLESLISFCIGQALALAGAGIVYDAVSRLGETAQAGAGRLPALAVALFSIISKEALYRWTAARGQSLQSEVLRAVALEHRSDAFSSIPVFLTVALSTWVSSLAVLDLIGALVVALFIFHSAWSICAASAHVLLDGGAGAEVDRKIAEFVLGLEGVKGLHFLRARQVGHGLILDMHMSADGSLTFQQAHDLAHQVEDALCSPKAAAFIGREVLDAIAHVDPY
ncbi:MAG: cation diffusion facilitator family transporter [Desulfovibrio sp.]|jgi:cation diffusion facilitator family transporter|nr:cation diffusion facilitator family transporter [Desulfovibrio sp.]